MKTEILVITSLLVVLMPGGTSVSCGENITEDTTLQKGVYQCTGKGLEITEDDVRLYCEDHRITGFNEKHSGIVAEGVENVSIEACDVSGFYNGISLDNVTDSRVVNSSGSSNYASGISLVSSHSNVVRDNEFDRNWDGIFLHNSTENRITGNSVHRNEIDGVHLFYGSFDNVVRGNDLSQNLGHGLAPAVCDNRIEGNVAGDGEPLKYVENTRDVEIADTSHLSEIIFCNVTDSTIRNVTINNSDLNTDGVLLVNSDRNKILSSTFNNVRTGVYLFRSSDSNRVVENTVTSSDLGIRLRKNSSNNRIIRNTVRSTEVYLKAVKGAGGNFFINNSLESSETGFVNNGSIEITKPIRGIEGKVNLTEPPKKSFKGGIGLFIALPIIAILLFASYAVYTAKSE
jgi:parallel beta-helix repeat protein